MILRRIVKYCISFFSRITKYLHMHGCWTSLFEHNSVSEILIDFFSRFKIMNIVSLDKTNRLESNDSKDHGATP